MRDVITDAVNKFVTLVRTPVKITPEVIAEIQGPLGQCTAPCKLGRVDLSEADLCETPCKKGLIDPSELPAAIDLSEVDLCETPCKKGLLDPSGLPVVSGATNSIKAIFSEFANPMRFYIEFTKPNNMNMFGLRILLDNGQFQDIMGYELNGDRVKLRVSRFSPQYVLWNESCGSWDNATWFISVDDVGTLDIVKVYAPGAYMPSFYKMSKETFASITFQSESDADFYAKCDATKTQNNGTFVLKNCQYVRAYVTVNTPSTSEVCLHMFKRLLPDERAFVITDGLKFWF